MSTAVTGDVRAVLAAARTEGRRLFLDGERLDPDLYARVARVLKECGGPWSRRDQAHVFPDADAAEVVAGILTLDRVVSAKERQQWYATPAEIVERLVVRAGLMDHMEVLEPSAGQGAIVKAVVAEGCAVDAIEMAPHRAAVLSAAGARKVQCADFLTVPPHPVYHRVIMNPPFTGNQDVRHVLHALRFLLPGGWLVSVMAAGIRYRDDKGSRKIRALADGVITPHAGTDESPLRVRFESYIIDLPDGAFRESGTDMATVMVEIPNKPWPPYFDPETAPPGVYTAGGLGGERVFRFTGNCVGCGARTWHHDHDAGDIRGPFGLNLCVSLDWYNLPDSARDRVADDAWWPRCGRCWSSQAKTRIAVGRVLASLDRPRQDPPPDPAPAPRRPRRPARAPEPDLDQTLF